MIQKMKTFFGNLIEAQTILIEPTNDCQLDCVTCYRKGRNVGYMYHHVYDLALSMLPKNTYAVNLNGAGEPLMHPDFVSMVNKLNAKRNWFGMKYKTGFSTNGLLLNADMQDQIIDKIDWINISLDGMAAEHEARRRGSDWEIVSQNAFDLIGTLRFRTKVSINLTRMNQSDEEIAEFKAYFQDADSVFVTDWHNSKMQSPGMAKSKCTQINNTRFILWNGDVTTCCGDLRGINVYGNICYAPLNKLRPKFGPLCKTCDMGRSN